MSDPAGNTAPPVFRVAVLYGYNGSGFRGLERSKGVSTVEGLLLGVLASFFAGPNSSKPVSLVNISRSAITEIGEHASRQVLSVEVSGQTNVPLPSVQDIQLLMPQAICIYDVFNPSVPFSARRDCDTRTVEYLIPSYCFAPPPPETQYCYPMPVDAQDLEWDEEDRNQPPGGLFKTLRRGVSLSRNKSTRTVRNRSLGRKKSISGNDNLPYDEDAPPLPTNSIRQPSYSRDDSIVPTPANEVSNPLSTLPSPPPSPHHEMRNSEDKKSGFKRFIQTITRKKNKKNDGPTSPVRQLSSSVPASSHSQLPPPPHETVAPSGGSNGQTTIKRSMSRGRKSLRRGKSVRANNNGDSSDNQFVDEDRGDNFGIMATLRRSLSRKSVRNLDPQDEVRLSDDAVSHEPQFFDPLHINPPTEDELLLLQQYKVTEDQMKSLKHILAMFNGTHNWHNYTVNSKYEDMRCYMRILNVECSQTEMHFGMEWVRVKLQAKAFARYQVRKMIALAIMVIRTNAPRSIVGNSFGFSSIEIPEAPAFAFVLDEPRYLTFATEAERRGDTNVVDFGKKRAEVTEFRHSHIHDWIYQTERDSTPFLQWLRSLDAYSFLYTYFLNQRGVVLPRRNFVSQSALNANHNAHMASAAEA